MSTADLTQPPESGAAGTPRNLRAALVSDLFLVIPQMADDIRTAPTSEPCLIFLNRLLHGPTPEEAVTFAAYALPPRHAIWWGHECLQSLPDLLTEQDREMLPACARWCGEPDETNRYAAMDLGLGAKKRGPGVWLAMATGWTGGSMTHPDQPAVPVPTYLIARALNAAVLSMLARVPLEIRRRTLAHFVSMADVLARSG